jgi:hypothetical protein
VSLSSALTANLPLKLTSLGLSVFLWFLAAAEEPASTLVPVDVAVQPPSGRTVVHAPRQVRALVTGPRRELLKLSTSPMRLLRILPDTTAADQVQLDLTPGELELPRGVDVHVQDVEPRTVSIELDSTFQRVVPVRADVHLPAELPRAERDRGGARHRASARSARGDPAHRLRPNGDPRGRAGRRAGRANPRPRHVGLRRVRAEPGQVTVRVTLEPLGERTLTRVPVRLPSELAASVRAERATVEVRVRGPATRLGALSRDSVPVVVDWSGPPGEGRAALRVLAPAGVEARALPDSLSLVRRRADG